MLIHENTHTNPDQCPEIKRRKCFSLKKDLQPFITGTSKPQEGI